MNNLWKWLDLSTGTSDENLKEQKFSAENYITYLVRESVQNSVDAWRKHYVDREDEREARVGGEEGCGGTLVLRGSLVGRLPSAISWIY